MNQPQPQPQPQPVTQAGIDALKFTHNWFEVNSGWAEPTRDTLVEWLADDVCQCADECWVAIDGVCEHGLASWLLVLQAMGDHLDLAGPERVFLLTNAPNFRDVGGVRTADGRVLRRGIVFRSGVMDTLDGADHSRMRALGIKTIIDVRSSDELEARPNRLPDGITTHHVPVHDVSAAPRSIMERIANGETDGLGAPMLINGNAVFATTHRAVFRRVLGLLADPNNWPVVVHCTAGKDRTGFSVAALLWALDIEPDDVMRDYMRSNDALDARHRALIDTMKQRELDPTVLMEMLQTAPGYLGAGLDAAIEEFGSLENWFVNGLGFNADTRNQWQSTMLTSL